MQIGCFHPVDDGFAGRLQTLGLDVPLRIAPIADRANDKAPDWRIHLDETVDGPQVGSGWTHRSDGISGFIAVQIDCPSLAQPIRARLQPSRRQRHVHVLLWSRPRPE